MNVRTEGCRPGGRREVLRQGRVVGPLEVRGQSLPAMLLRRGLGGHYKLHAPDDTTLERPEQEARTAERGLWSQPTPVAPWEWQERGTDKEGANTRDQGERPPFEGPPGPSCVDPVAGPPWAIEGRLGPFVVGIIGDFFREFGRRQPLVPKRPVLPWRSSL